MNNPKLPEYNQGTQWQKGQSGNPAGRKPSRLKKFIKAYDVTKEDIDAIFRNILFNYSFDELHKLYKSLNKDDMEYKGDLSVGVAAFISGIMNDIKRGDMRVVNQILDRIYGKATEKHNINHTGNISIGKPPSPEDAYPD